MLDKPLKIIFAGTPDFAATILKPLLQQHHVIAVYTQPDRKAGRGQQLTASPVKQVALANDIPVFQPLSLKKEEAQQQLQALDADLMVVVAYGLILPQAILDLPRLGCINVHASLLPAWRGAAPIQRAIEAGDQETGITIMQMDAGLDTGDMLYKATCPIENTDSSQSLHDKLADIGAQALLHTLSALDKLTPEKQTDALSTYAAKIQKQEGFINWQQPARDIYNKIRAFNPWPGTFTQLDGQTLKIWQADIEPCNVGAIPGTIVSATHEGIDIATQKDLIRIKQLQLPGGKRLSCDAMLNAKKALFLPGKLLQST